MNKSRSDIAKASIISPLFFAVVSLLFLVPECGIDLDCIGVGIGIGCLIGGFVGFILANVAFCKENDRRLCYAGVILNSAIFFVVAIVYIVDITRVGP